MDPANNFEVQASREKLLDIFGSSPDLVFIRAEGNIGDELTCAGTRQLLSGLKYREVNIHDLQNVTGHTALLSGSGGWCKSFHSLPGFLPMIEDRFQAVIVLPSSFDTSEEIVKKALQKTKALVYARDRVSYRQIQPLCKSDIAHDCGFFFDFEKYKRNGEGVLNAFREDALKNPHHPLPEDNIDLSAVCSSLDEWLWTISKYELIRTDRAHVLIAGALLGKHVEYSMSEYHKVPAIAEYALKGYPVHQIPEPSLTKSFVAKAKNHPSGSHMRRKPSRMLTGKGKIYEFAAFLAERSSSSKVVSLDNMESLGLEAEYPEDAIVIIPDGISTLERFPQLIEPLKKMLKNVQKIILSDTNSVRDRLELEAFFNKQGLPAEFVGYVNEQGKKVGTLALISQRYPSLPIHTPVNFRVIAVIAAYNEEDVIIPVINQLNQEGIEVYLIDNWSTDETYQRAKSLMGKGLIGLERFPIDGPSPVDDWVAILKRKEELCQELDADWFIHHDADEFRESPWKGICLRDAIYWVDQQGYNAIDFTVLNFPPIDNNYQPGTSFIDYFKYFELGKNPGHFVQIKSWKKTRERVNLHDSGGHRADFSARKIYPYKFLLRHYPIRSQSHGEKKIFQERKQRYDPLEVKKGWHIQYDPILPGSNLLNKPEELREFNSSFYSDYLIERLSGIGAIPPAIENNGKLEDHTVESLMAQLAERESQVAEKEQIIAQLNHELSAIKISQSWKIALLFRRIRSALLPRNSRRA